MKVAEKRGDSHDETRRRPRWAVGTPLPIQRRDRGEGQSDGKVAALGKQCGQLDEKLVDIDVKLDQLVRLLTPEPIAPEGLTTAY